MKLIKKVKSIGELRQLAEANSQYLALAIAAARNLGGMNIIDLQSAMNWLWINASETSEEGVIGEINFCRDLV